MRISKKNIETIKKNIENLELVCEKYPILKEYWNNPQANNNLNNMGLNDWVSFINFLNDLKRDNIEPYYENLTYRELRKKLVAINKNEKSAKTFSKKTERDFISILFNSSKLKRYTNWNNLYYFTGFTKGFPLILNYIIHKMDNLNEEDTNFPTVEIDSSGDKYINYYTNQSTTYYEHLIKIPDFRNLEFEMVDKFIDNFERSLGEFDFRKCNLNLLKNKITLILEEKFKIESESTVKALEDICINNKLVIKKDEYYQVISSFKDYNGFLQIYVSTNPTTPFPYSKFEEVSRLRDDLLNELFGNSGS